MEEGSGTLLFLYAALELNNARPEQANGTVHIGTEIPHLLPQHPHLAQILSDAGHGTRRSGIRPYGQLFSNWAGSDPGVQFRFGRHD